MTRWRLSEQVPCPCVRVKRSIVENCSEVVSTACSTGETGDSHTFGHRSGRKGSVHCGKGGEGLLNLGPATRPLAYPQDKWAWAQGCATAQGLLISTPSSVLLFLPSTCLETRVSGVWMWVVAAYGTTTCMTCVQSPV